MTQPNVYTMGFREDYQQLCGLGDLWSTVATAAGASASIIASGAATSTFVAFGVTALAVPVIGQIAGAVAIAAGIIAAARAKSKATRNNINDIETQQKELRLQNSDLDNAILNLAQEQTSIYQQLQKIGLNGIGDWLKKNLTPNRYYGNIQQDATDEYNSLVAQIETKISAIEKMKNDLVDLSDRLTGAKTRRIVVYSVAGAGAIGLIYLGAKSFGWIK